MNVEALYKKAKASRDRERIAARRLRLAQTIFDKHYRRTQDLLDTIERIETETRNVAARLLGE